MTTPALSVAHCSKIYTNGFHAVKDVSFAIPPGQFTVLLGLNGAGKSSLISMISGLATISQGHIRINGYDNVGNSFEAKRCIGICPQEVNFNIFHTIEQELLIAAGLHNLREAQALTRIKPLLERARLWPKRHELIRNLSGGMKRILMVIRAMLHKPQLLLLDEPTAGVDIEIRDMIWDLLRNTHQEGTAILLTTHNMQEAQQLCEHIILIHQGQLLRQQSIKEAVLSLSSQPYSIQSTQTLSPQQQQQLEKLKAHSITETTFIVDTSQDKPLAVWLSKIQQLGIDIDQINPSKNQLEQLLQEITSA